MHWQFIIVKETIILFSIVGYYGHWNYEGTLKLCQGRQNVWENHGKPADYIKAYTV